MTSWRDLTDPLDGITVKYSWFIERNQMLHLPKEFSIVVHPFTCAQLVAKDDYRLRLDMVRDFIVSHINADADRLIRSLQAQMENPS